MDKAAMVSDMARGAWEDVRDLAQPHNKDSASANTILI